MTFTLPAGQRAYNALPSHRKRYVDALARQVRGKPWPVICDAASDIRKTYDVTVAATPAIKEAAAKNGEITVMALLERIGARPYDLVSPHQATLYRSCVRPEYQEAGRAYIRELGGEHALPEAMETWERNHPTEMG